MGPARARRGLAGRCWCWCWCWCWCCCCVAPRRADALLADVCTDEPCALAHAAVAASADRRRGAAGTVQRNLRSSPARRDRRPTAQHARAIVGGQARCRHSTVSTLGSLHPRRLHAPPAARRQPASAPPGTSTSARQPQSRRTTRPGGFRSLPSSLRLVARGPRALPPVGTSGVIRCAALLAFKHRPHPTASACLSRRLAAPTTSKRPFFRCACGRCFVSSPALYTTVPSFLARALHSLCPARPVWSAV